MFVTVPTEATRCPQNPRTLLGRYIACVQSDNFPRILHRIYTDCALCMDPLSLQANAITVSIPVRILPGHEQDR